MASWTGAMQPPPVLSPACEMMAEAQRVMPRAWPQFNALVTLVLNNPAWSASPRPNGGRSGRVRHIVIAVPLRRVALSKPVPSVARR